MAVDHECRVSGPRLTATLAPSRRICLLRWMARRPRIAVEFLRRVRDERKFENAEALKAQILRDVNRAQTYFRRLGQAQHRRVDSANARESRDGGSRIMSLSEGKVRHMKALSNKQGVIAAAAMDQRGSLKKSIASAKGIPADQVTSEMMSEFKVAVSKVLTPHASAILLDPEFGLPAAKARSSNAGLLLAYEESGYDNTKPGRLPDLLPHVSAKRIADWGADAVKILLYYSPFDDRASERHQARVHRTHRRGVRGRCRSRFSCEFVGYDPKGGDEKGWSSRS